MTKGTQQKKSVKKQAVLSPKEKKAAKRLKKAKPTTGLNLKS